MANPPLHWPHLHRPGRRSTLSNAAAVPGRSVPRSDWETAGSARGRNEPSGWAMPRVSKGNADCFRPMRRSPVLALWQIPGLLGLHQQLVLRVDEGLAAVVGQLVLLFEVDGVLGA